MKTAKLLFLVSALFLGTSVCVNAQWPLGKELGQNSFKLGEPPATITVNGRYQIFVSPNLKGHTFMIDTDTGKVWIMKKDHSSGDYSLQRVPVEQVDAQKPAAGATEPLNTDKKPAEKK